jgi:hypothetical protein
MTAQLPDTVDYRGTELTLARARGTGLFDPKDHALPVAMASTLSWRGYVCHYALVDGHLALATLEANVARVDDDDVIVRVAPPDLGGVSGQPGNPPFSTTYRSLAMPVAFTGQLVVGEGAIEALVGNLPLPEPWHFRVAHLLTFEGGALVAERDVSTDMATLRDAQAAGGGAAPRIEADDLRWLQNSLPGASPD